MAKKTTATNSERIENDRPGSGGGNNILHIEN